MSACLERLFAGLQPAFGSAEQFQRARQQWLAGLVNLGRHTISGTLTTAGLQHQDWSASYRALQQVPVHDLFGYVRQHALERSDGPWIVALDDSCTHKTGRRIPGCTWRRDPLSPPFSVNFRWGQRVLQLSAALPAADRSARLVPIDWCEAPTVRKPSARATAEEQAAYREAKRQANLNRIAVQRMNGLRQATGRPIHFVCDGRFTNRTVLRHLPAATVLIGRIRRDTRLYAPCSPLKASGRPRRYGTALPTPEQWRTNEALPWQSVRAHACGTDHDIRVKTMHPVMARIHGVEAPVQVVVIAPLGYRLHQAGKMLYRQPAYLICTDPALPVATLVQEYLWRWEIEVNFRDEKTLLGVSEPQLRNPEAVTRQPASAVAAYALLLLAAADCYSHDQLPPTIPPPKWRRQAPPRRATTALLISQLRAELWSQCLRPDTLAHFCSPNPRDRTADKPPTNLAAALFYAKN